MNTELFEKARELGEMIAASPEYKKMRKAQDAFEADEEAKRSLGELEKLRENMKDIESILTPEALNSMRISMKVVKQRIDSSRVISEMQAAKEEFHALMGEVNQVIHFVIAGQAASAPMGPPRNSAGARVH